MYPNPFPFISNLGLNLAGVITERKRKGNRFILDFGKNLNILGWVEIVGIVSDTDNSFEN